MLPIVPYVLAFMLGGAAMMGNPMAGFGIAGIFMLIGFVGAIVVLVYYCLSGTPGDNRYGPNPYGQSAGVAG